MNDHQLLHQFVTQNSQQAFRRLAERHTDWLYSVCLRRLRDPSLAEDAVQAVFFALAQKAPSLLHESTLSPWLHQAARFVAANILRAKKRRTRHESEAAAMTPTPISPPPDWREIELDLEPALDRLSSRDRQMILLRFYEQKSHPEIAAVLHISEAAAAKRLSRALERLRSLLTRNSAERATLSSAVITSLLLSHGVTPAPPTLAASTAAVTVHTTTATLAKGAITAMALAKLQTAALITAACLLIAIPATVITLKEMSAAPPPAPTAPSVAATPIPIATAPAATLANPAPDSFDSVYGLAPGQLVKRITDAPPEIRGPFLREKFGERSPTRGSIFVGWMDNAVNAYSYSSARSYTLSTFAGQVLGVHSEEIEGDLAQHSIPGDFAYSENKDNTPDQLCAALQKIVHDELNLPAIIQFRDVSRTVIVLRGQWKYTANLDIPNTGSPRGPNGGSISCIDIYGGDPFDNTSMQSASGSGNVKTIGGMLSSWLNQQVVIEADGLPNTFGYRCHSSRSNEAIDHDRTSVLKHITEQTGLTWSEETRTVRHLFITSTPTP